MFPIDPQCRQLPNELLSQLEQQLRDFEDVWRLGSDPLRSTLPPHGSSRLPCLVELIHAELELRLEAGEAARVEDYLRRYPELASHSDLVLELIATEYRLRRDREAQCTPDEYLRRFPTCGAQLAERLQLQATAPQPFDPAGTPVDSLDQVTLIRPSSAADGAALPEATSGPGLTGRYQILGEIGRGGMGAVLEGRDRALGRDLAVKVLLDRFQDDVDIVRRFREEAQVGGQLQHPGIVPVHELGRFPDGRPYFTMKLVEGRTLAALLMERAEPARDLPRFVKIFEQVCQTMAYAHSRGVIHRDLKPNNIMVGAFGEVQVMGWGLAKVRGVGKGEPELAPVRTERAAQPDGHTGVGEILGTPAYMAPEQARGEISGGGPCYA